MELGLRGKVAVVTGAGGGIGSELAKALDAMGCRVVICDVSPDAARAVASELSGDSACLVADLSVVANCARLVQETVERFGRLDILINAAAVLRRIPIEDSDERLWDQIVNTNLKSVFFLSKEACRAMKQTRFGRIVNFSSQGAFTGGLSQSAVYNITKGGILTLTKSFARTYARDGITVNAIAPGMVDTDMMKIPAPELEAIIRTIPMGRMAVPSELVGAVLYLASDWSAYVTGATLEVTGGQLMR